MTKPSLGSSLFVAFSLGGCATKPDIQDPPPPAEDTHAAISADLVKLRELDVFSVGHIIRDLPAEATGCYFDDIGGLPCPGWEDEVAAADAALRPRLDKLVAAAVSAVSRPDPAYVMDQARVTADLAALRALKVVEVGE